MVITLILEALPIMLSHRGIQDQDCTESKKGSI